MLFNQVLVTATLVTLAAAAVVPSEDMEKRSTPKGFVQATGNQFTLDGKPFYFVGANAYWLAQLPTNADVDATFKSMADAGVKVVRTWAFSELQSYPGVTYYQTLKDGKQVINEGADGLQKLDYVVQSAEKHGLKLVLAFANNWSDYGGMDEYTKNLAADKTVHSSFYKDAAVKKAYKAYVKNLIGKWKKSPAIFSWQLANEPRCGGSSIPAGDCNVQTITDWVTEMSAYIKSQDKNHMVSIGDEGFFNWAGRPEYIWNGGAGIDWDANLQLKNIDYGTFHLYPEHWGITNEVATQYITDHTWNANKYGKPVVIEEFGLVSEDQKVQWYQTWAKAGIDTGIDGIMPWQWGQRGLSNGDSHDDGYANYPDEPVFQVLKDIATQMNAKSN